MLEWCVYFALGPCGCWLAPRPLEPKYGEPKAETLDAGGPTANNLPGPIGGGQEKRAAEQTNSVAIEV